jgi:hypothetical protein
MGGRARALLLAVASAGSLLFAWFAAALIALVTLRKGVVEGFQLLLWSTLPALVLLRVTGDSTVLALIVGTAVLAMVLRTSTSLVLTALATTLVALVTGALTAVFADAMLEELVQVFREFLANLQAQGGAELEFRVPTPLLLAGMIGTANGLLCFLCLVLARYWQAGLYNPGGFGAEFRALRYPPAVAWGLGLAALGLISAGFDWRSWGAALLLPLTIAGFALLHARARQRGQGSFWLGAVYVGWVVFDAAKLALIGLALADALLDFRRRWAGTDDGAGGSGTPPSVPRGDDAQAGPQDDADKDRTSGPRSGSEDSEGDSDSDRDRDR